MTLFRYIVLTIIAAFLLGCSAHQTYETTGHYWSDRADEPSRKMGVALAGGGTKAASFSMGILSALVNTGEIWDTDAVSTVSGGSYAGLFLYSRLIYDKTHGDYGVRQTASYFQDCMPVLYRSVFADEGRASGEQRINFMGKEYCTDSNPHNLDENKQYLHQQYLRCSQDILEKSCTFTTTTNDNSAVPGVIDLTAGTVMSLPFSLTANTLFDWPVNLSPSMQAYKEGMGVAYAMRPEDSSVLSENNKVNACRNGHYTNCKVVDGAGDHLPQKVTLDPQERPQFSDLRALYQGKLTPPVWMLNATAAPSRSIWGWLRNNQTDMYRYTFSMTAFEQSSDQSGVLDLEREGVDLLSAATASAAFFDANQTVLEQPWKFLGGVGQHIMNLNWGIDVPAQGVSRSRRVIRSFLPFPLYYADYALFKNPAYIRLIDGGSSDNTGAYRMITDGFRDVVIADNAQDVDGRMTDICMLRNELAIRHGLYFHVPGLTDWPAPCTGIRHRSMEDGRQVAEMFPVHDIQASDSEKPYFYPIHAWPYPFLLGCISTSESLTGCMKNPDAQRAWIIKPAIDYAYYIRRQTDRNGSVMACGNQTSVLIPCETAAFLVNNSTVTNDYGFPRFPQNGTVAMTLDSSSAMYGAYRELADFYMTTALAAIRRVKDHPELFNQLMDVQKNHPLPAAEHKPAFERTYPAGDINHPGWTDRIRDRARKRFMQHL
ncbi:MAG: hypothetical protein CMI02_00820 [Oceanospirillaceae bacterium]|nr:hypothetical protein [Oceanospirillaceae bacterium]MBT10561.1 hypothetical protein [Oceanospirillaceae bacterium]